MQASPVFLGGPFLHIGFEGVIRVAAFIEFTIDTFF
jgi:hypothetical protein